MPQTIIIALPIPGNKDLFTRLTYVVDKKCDHLCIDPFNILGDNVISGTKEGCRITSSHVGKLVTEGPSAHQTCTYPDYVPPGQVKGRDCLCRD